MTKRRRIPGRRSAFVALVVLAAASVTACASVATPPTAPTPSSAATATAAPPTPAASPTSPGASIAPPSPLGPPVISGIHCDVDEGTTYHVHAALIVRFGGELQTVPDGIGILPTCIYWLHTHAGHGIIHIEAPVETAFTLGQFFDVWGEPLSPTGVLGRSIAPGESLVAFVDRVPFDGDPRSIVLGNLVAIELQVGSEALEPLRYTFPAEFQ
jgi:hypothetical protein